MAASTDATRAAFATWRDQSVDHGRAYDHVAHAHASARMLAAEYPLLALRQAAVARAALRRGPSRIRPRAVAAALVLLATAPLAAFGLHALAAPKPAQSAGETFRTGIGQQADVTLPDGSTVTLDTASRLQVRFTGTARQVLLDGQAWFKVAASPLPFVVTAGGHTFTATPGDYDVRTDAAQTRAFAAHGALAMTDAGGAVALDPGHLLVVRGSDVTIRRPVDPAAITGWRDGLLLLHDIPVAEAAAELNRYRLHPIRIADSRTALLRISGAFRTAETPAFVEALTAGFPVRAKQDSNGSVLIAAR